MDAAGRSLYLYTKDERNVSNCTGGCALAWPPLTTVLDAVAGEGLAADRIGTTSRADGSNCGAPLGESGLCFWHDPERREERLEASRKGGSRRTIPLPVGPPLEAEEARGVLAAVMAALLEGALDPGTARAAAYILQVDRKIAEGETLERQLSIIEELTQQRRIT